MKPIYQQTFTLTDDCVDRYGRLKPSMLLYFVQEVAGIHGASLGVDYQTLAKRNLFWAILRTKIQITRLPCRGQTIRLETWPLPPTRVSYPRSVIAYDASGKELFRGISLWVLMDQTSRQMVLPGKSGITISGLLQGSELTAPGSLSPRTMANWDQRTVRYTDLDINGHMNNTRYFEWIYDLLPSSFHADHVAKEFTICYLSEAREAEQLSMNWEIGEEDTLRVEGIRKQGEPQHRRVFAAEVRFDA